MRGKGSPCTAGASRRESPPAASLPNTSIRAGMVRTGTDCRTLHTPVAARQPPTGRCRRSSFPAARLRHPTKLPGFAAPRAGRGPCGPRNWTARSSPRPAPAPTPRSQRRPARVRLPSPVPTLAWSPVVASGGHAKRKAAPGTTDCVLLSPAAGKSARRRRTGKVHLLGERRGSRGRPEQLTETPD